MNDLRFAQMALVALGLHLVILWLTKPQAVPGEGCNRWVAKFHEGVALFRKTGVWGIAPLVYAFHYTKWYAVWLFANVALSRLVGVKSLYCTPFWHPVLVLAAMSMLVEWLHHHTDCREGSVSEFRSARLAQGDYATRTHNWLLVLAALWLLEAAFSWGSANAMLDRIAAQRGIEVSKLVEDERAKINKDGKGDADIVAVYNNRREPNVVPPDPNRLFYRHLVPKPEPEETRIKIPREEETKTAVPAEKP